MLHFRPFIAKTYDSILRKSPKILFLGIFSPFSPIFEKMRIFPKKWALSLFYVYGPLTLTSCKKTRKKLMNQSWELCVTDGRTDRRMDRQHWIHRTTRRGSKKKKNLDTCTSWHNYPKYSPTHNCNELIIKMNFTICFCVYVLTGSLTPVCSCTLLTWALSPPPCVRTMYVPWPLTYCSTAWV